MPPPCNPQAHEKLDMTLVCKGRTLVQRLVHAHVEDIQRDACASFWRVLPSPPPFHMPYSAFRIPDLDQYAVSLHQLILFWIYRRSTSPLERFSKADATSLKTSTPSSAALRLRARTRKLPSSGTQSSSSHGAGSLSGLL